MKFFLYFLMFYLFFTLKGYSLDVLWTNKCSSRFSPKASRLREQVTNQRIKSLIEGLKAFVFEVEKKNRETKQFNLYEHIDLDIHGDGDPIDLKKLFDFIRATGYATYGGHTMGKIVEDLTHNSLPDFSHQLGIKISNPENQILRNAIIHAGIFPKELDFILFEKEVDLDPHEKKKVLIIETKTRLKPNGITNLYHYMRNNSVPILQYLSTSTGEPFTSENTSLYSMFTFIELYDKKLENFQTKLQTKNRSHEFGMLLVKIKIEEGNQLEILSDVDGEFEMFDFSTGLFGKPFNF